MPIYTNKFTLIFGLSVFSYLDSYTFDFDENKISFTGANVSELPKPFPLWAILAICIGGALIIGAVIAIFARRKRVRENLTLLNKFED